MTELIVHLSEIKELLNSRKIIIINSLRTPSLQDIVKEELDVTMSISSFPGRPLNGIKRYVLHFNNEEEMLLFKLRYYK